MAKSDLDPDLDGESDVCNERVGARSAHIDGIVAARSSSNLILILIRAPAYVTRRPKAS